MVSPQLNRKLTYTSADSLPYVGGAVLVCLLIGIFILFYIGGEARRYQERSEVFTQNTTNMLAQHIGDVFDSADSMLKMVAYQYNEQRASKKFEPKKFNAYLDHALLASPQFEELRVLDQDAVLRYGSGTAISPISLADRDYFIRLRDLPAGSANSPMVFAGPLFTRLTKQWVLVIARRLENSDGSFAGIAFINLHNEVFGNLFASIKLGPEGALVLRTSEMTQVDRFPRGKNPDADVGNNKVSQKLRDLIKSAPDGGTYEATTKYDNITRYYSYLKVAQYPFYIIAGEAPKDFITSLGGNFYLLLAFSALLMLMTVAGFWRFYQLTQQRVHERIDQQAELIINASPLAMLLVDRENVVKKANHAASRVFSRPLNELLGMSGERLVAKSSLGMQAEITKRVFQSTEPETALQVEVDGLRRDGSEVPLHVSLSSVEIEGVRHAILVLEDLTERRRTEARLHALLNLQSAILDHSAYAIIATDAEGAITLFNPAAEKMLGYSAEEVVGRCTPMIFHDHQLNKALLNKEDAADFNALVLGMREERAETSEMVYCRKDGTYFIGSLSLAVLLDERGQVTGFLGVVADITEMKQEREHLDHLAHYDTLTNLPNRKLFFDRVDQGLTLAKRNQSHLALLFLDLDNFKPVNDTWGHAMGDLLLKEVALRIVSCLRETDSVGRIGGDEFVVLLMNLNASNDAILVAEKIRHALAQPFLLEGQPILIGSCLGVALYSEHGTTSTELAKNADIAMYQAKEMGRDRVILFSQEMDLGS